MVYISLQGVDELFFDIHFLAETFGCALVAESHFMFLVDLVRAEERVATEVSLDCAGGVEGHEGAEGELFRDFLTLQRDEIPLGSDKRVILALDVFV